MVEPSISGRLRHLKVQNGWTVQEMADEIGMSRRTLESYMRRQNPALPGVDALRQIAKGLGVSLDWLLLPDLYGKIGTLLIVRATTEKAALDTVRSLIERIAALEKIEPSETPEYVAREIAAKAATLADYIVTNGATSPQVAKLVADADGRLEDVLKDRIKELKRQIELLTAANGTP